MTRTLVLMIATLGMITGCDRERCPEGMGYAPLPGGGFEDECSPLPVDDAGPDASPPDAGDAGADAGPCGMACTGATLVCDTGSGMCVGCLAETDCTAPAGLCDPATNLCVACLGDGDCIADPAIPICEAGACRACTADADCAGMAASPVCDEPSGRCVECTVDSEATTCGPPANRACHPTDLTCTGQERGTLGFCEACVSDSECIINASGENRCVPMDFEGSSHGSYCLLDQSTLVPAGPCPDRMTADRLGTSVLGVEATYCFVQENITTCEAVLGFNDLCPGGDADCGASGLDDGHCDGGRCTYECSGGSDCSSGSCAGAPTTYCE